MEKVFKKCSLLDKVNKKCTFYFHIIREKKCAFLTKSTIFLFKLYKTDGLVKSEHFLKGDYYLMVELNVPYSAKELCDKLFGISYDSFRKKKIKEKYLKELTECYE